MVSEQSVDLLITNVLELLLEGFTFFLEFKIRREAVNSSRPNLGFAVVSSSQ